MGSYRIRSEKPQAPAGRRSGCLNWWLMPSQTKARVLNRRMNPMYCSPNFYKIVVSLCDFVWRVCEKSISVPWRTRRKKEAGGKQTDGVLWGLWAFDHVFGWWCKPLSFFALYSIFCVASSVLSSCYKAHECLLTTCWVATILHGVLAWGSSFSQLDQFAGHFVPLLKRLVYFLINVVMSLCKVSINHLLNIRQCYLLCFWRSRRNDPVRLYPLLKRRRKNKTKEINK